MNAILVGESELRVIRRIMERRVMEVVAKIPDVKKQRDTIIAAWRAIGSALVAKFGVIDVLEIPVDRFADALDFLESVPVTT